MSVSEDWNTLRLALYDPPADGEVTAAMVDAVRQRIAKAGGSLTVWAILQEDCYETSLGDGFYLSLNGIALNEEDANRLAEMGQIENDRNTNANRTTGYKMHVRRYALGLTNDTPTLSARREPGEGFTISTFVQIVAEIPPGGTASRLHIGWDKRGAAPFVSLPER